MEEVIAFLAQKSALTYFFLVTRTSNIHEEIELSLCPMVFHLFILGPKLLPVFPPKMIISFKSIEPFLSSLFKFVQVLRYSNISFFCLFISILQFLNLELFSLKLCATIPLSTSSGHSYLQIKAFSPYVHTKYWVGWVIK